MNLLEVAIADILHREIPSAGVSNGSVHTVGFAPTHAPQHDVSDWLLFIQQNRCCCGAGSNHTSMLLLAPPIGRLGGKIAHDSIVKVHGAHKATPGWHTPCGVSGGYAWQ